MMGNSRIYKNFITLIFVEEFKNTMSTIYFVRPSKKKYFPKYIFKKSILSINSSKGE